MATVQEFIDVSVPVSTAYNQWTQFETFPEFMGGVESITQISDTRSHWVTKVGGAEREFDTEITEQHPDERIAWKSTDGKSHAGVVTFHRLDDTNTRVTVQLDWDPENFTEKVGAAVGADDRQVKADLARFKEFIENTGNETGAWRGNVDAPGSGSATVSQAADPLADGPGLADPSLDDPESGGPRAANPA
ncbi:MAG: SRPBCC family protein [Actinomycetes bacterium]